MWNCRKLQRLSLFKRWLTLLIYKVPLLLSEILPCTFYSIIISFEHKFWAKFYSGCEYKNILKIGIWRMLVALHNKKIFFLICSGEISNLDYIVKYFSTKKESEETYAMKTKEHLKNLNKNNLWNSVWVFLNVKYEVK